MPSLKGVQYFKSRLAYILKTNPRNHNPSFENLQQILIILKSANLLQLI